MKKLDIDNVKIFYIYLFIVIYYFILQIIREYIIDRNITLAINEAKVTEIEENDEYDENK